MLVCPIFLREGRVDAQTCACVDWSTHLSPDVCSALLVAVCVKLELKPLKERFASSRTNDRYDFVFLTMCFVTEIHRLQAPDKCDKQICTNALMPLALLYAKVLDANDAG